MHARLILCAALAATAVGCSQRDKKPRLAEQRVVGTWTSDTLPDVAAGDRRVYQLRMTSSGLAELTREVVGRRSAVERGTWDGADSLVRVVVRGDATAARATSILLAMRGRSALALVQFDTTAWGAAGVTLYRR